MKLKTRVCLILQAVLIAMAIPGFAGQQENAARAPSSAEDITVPDGTPLMLQLEKSLSSATAKVGDPIEFKVASPVLAQGFVVVPVGTAVSGTIVQVRRRGHFGRNGEVSIAIKELALSSGDHLSARQILEPPQHKHSTGKAAGEVGRATVESVPFFGVTLPMMAVAWGFQKGVEETYPAGNVIELYINGPISLNRNAFTNLPYKEKEPVPPARIDTGRAQVFFKNGGCLKQGDCDPVILFLGKKRILQLSGFVRVEFEPGTYWFTTDKTEGLLIELVADHQYWVERQDGKLIEDDPDHHSDEIGKFFPAYQR